MGWKFPVELYCIKKVVHVKMRRNERHTHGLYFMTLIISYKLPRWGRYPLAFFATYNLSFSEVRSTKSYVQEIAVKTPMLSKVNSVR